MNTNQKNKKFTFMPAVLITSVMILNLPLFGQGPIESNLNKVLIWNSPSGHNNTPQLNDWIAQMGQENGFEVDVAEGGSDFSALNLLDYEVIFSINGDFFGRGLTSGQRGAVEDFVAGSKGLGCLHQCNRPEGDWDWYVDLMACRYQDHAGNNEAVVLADIEGEGHDARGSLMETDDNFSYQEEWYNPQCNPRGLEGVKIMWTVDESTIPGGGGSLGGDHPVAWTRDYAGGRYFMNTGGHNDNVMTHEIFSDHMLGALKYLAGYSGCMDSNSPAYNEKATTQPPGACDVVVEGCMDSLYAEFNPDATVEPAGACQTLSINLLAEGPRGSMNFNNLKISITDKGFHQVTIFDAKGTEVFSARGTGASVYQPQIIEQGIFFVRIKTSDKIINERVILF